MAQFNQNHVVIALVAIVAMISMVTMFQHYSGVENIAGLAVEDVTGEVIEQSVMQNEAGPRYYPKRSTESQPVEQPAAEPEPQNETGEKEMELPDKEGLMAVQQIPYMRNTVSRKIRGGN